MPYHAKKSGGKAKANAALSRAKRTVPTGTGKKMAKPKTGGKPKRIGRK